MKIQLLTCSLKFSSWLYLVSDYQVKKLNVFFSVKVFTLHVADVAFQTFSSERPI